MYSAEYKPALAGFNGRVTFVVDPATMTEDVLERFKPVFWQWLIGEVPALPVVPMRSSVIPHSEGGSEAFNVYIVASEQGVSGGR
jgi:hypothetical protein